MRVFKHHFNKTFELLRYVCGYISFDPCVQKKHPVVRINVKSLSHFTRQALLHFMSQNQQSMQVNGCCHVFERVMSCQNKSYQLKKNYKLLDPVLFQKVSVNHAFQILKKNNLCYHIVLLNNLIWLTLTWQKKLQTPKLSSHFWMIDPGWRTKLFFTFL